jgi:transcriptional regulator with XRE-family HTH domain
MPSAHNPAMPSRTNVIHEASRQAAWALHEIGREYRLARIQAGMTQRQVGAAAGRSQSRVSRVEAGAVPRISLVELMRIAAAIGLKLWTKTFPGGRRPLDSAQLSLLRRFNARLHQSWSHELEAVIPLPGDLRAVDELIRSSTCSCAVEAITRFVDVQAQVRPARAKQRDIGADRLILLISATHANRRTLHAAGPIIRETFPISTRHALVALARGRDPGGNCLILL